MRPPFLNLFIGCALILLFQDSFAQKFSPKNRYHSIGASINAMNYVGEVDPGPSIISPALYFTRSNFGVSYTRRHSAHLSYRFNFSYGRIKGDDYENADYSIKDVHRKLRNLNFRNQIYELKADIVFDIIGNYTHYRKRPDYVPYVFAGLAYFHHNPEGQAPNGDWVKLRPLSTEGQGIPGLNKKPYSLHQIAIPIGLGFRYKLARQWDLAFEVGWRFTFTDYLDDVGSSYADRDAILNSKGELAALMADRTHEAMAKDQYLKEFVEQRQGGYVDKNNQPHSGNGYQYINSYNTPGAQRGDLNKDWYIVTGIHLTYILPPRVICPKFRN